MIYVAIGSALILVILFIGYLIKTRNEFVKLKVKIEETESGIDVALTKRYDVLTKLLDITKGYAEHEKSILVETAKFRAGSTLKEKEAFNSELTKAFGAINMVAENYPVLTANATFRELQVSVSDTEEHLQAARRAYNSTVSIFNQKIDTFPSNIVADSMSLKKAEFFQADEEKKNDVSMKF